MTKCSDCGRTDRKCMKLACGHELCQDCDLRGTKAHGIHVCKFKKRSPKCSPKRRLRK